VNRRVGAASGRARETQRQDLKVVYQKKWEEGKLEQYKTKPTEEKKGKKENCFQRKPERRNKGLLRKSKNDASDPPAQSN